MSRVWAKYMALLFLPVYFFQQSIIAQAPPVFQQYTIAEGLSNNYISCIHKDKRGFLWLGTNEGINRFDGYQFEQYKFNPDDSTRSLTNSWVEKIYEDTSGVLWLGTRNGITSLNPLTGAIKRFYYSQPLRIHDILPVKGSKDFWAATNKGLFILHTATGQWQEQNIYFKQGIYILSMALDTMERLWLSTYSYGVIQYNYNKHVSKQFPIPELNKNLGRVNAILGPSLIDRNNNFWVTSWYSGLVCINTTNGSIKIYSHNTKDTYSIGGNGGMGVMEDKNGKIWIAGISGGYYVYDAASGKFENYLFNSALKNNGGSLLAASIYKDDDGVYWVGTDKGLNKYDADNERIKTVSLLVDQEKNKPGGVVFNDILSLVKQNDSLIWVGTSTGLYLLSQKQLYSGSTIKLQSAYVKGAVTALKKDAEGNVWAGCEGFVAKSLFNQSTRLFSFKKIPVQGQMVDELYADKTNVWMGTYGGGLYKYNISSGAIAHYIPSTALQIKGGDNIIYSILPLTGNRLLLATNNEGLCTFNTLTNTFADVMPSQKIPGNKADYSSVLDLFRDSKNNIWITTQFGGLLKTNDSLQHFTQITEKDGLPSLRIDYMAEDSLHNLWLAGLGRLILYNTDAFKINVFTGTSGLSGANNAGPVYMLNNNTMLFAENNALHSFQPTDFVANKKPPKVYITSCKIFDRNIATTASGPVKLEYNQNYFSFEYVGISYSHSEQNRYSYMLDGLDKSWHYAGKTRTVSYANLTDGTYTFKVKACNSEGLWNDVPATFTVTITPPFWRRWWFYVAAVLAVATLIYMLYRLRLNQLKKEMGIRDKIASDLHDDVGSTISSIRFFTTVAYDTAADSGGHAVTPMIKRIDEASEKILYSLDDIVWSVNPENDRIELMASRITEFAAEMLEARNIKLNIYIQPAINNLKLSLAKRHDFFLIYKEAVNNLAKYSCAGTANISLTKEKNKVVLVIEDDGKGFDIANVKRGDGLNNMQKRADKIKAELTIISTANKGTTIKLSCTPT